MGFLSGFGKAAWEKAKARGEKAEKAGEFATALRHYEKAAESCPTDQRSHLEHKQTEVTKRLFDCHLEAADDYLHAGDLEHARERLELALSFAPGHEERDTIEARLRDLQSEAIVRSEEVDEDDDELDEVDLATTGRQDVFLMLIGGLPEHIADAYEDQDEAFRQAFIAAQEGRPDEAIDAFTDAAKTSREAVVHYELGSCLRALDRAEEAIEALQRAEELDPEWPAIKVALAEAYWSVEQWDQAEQVLQRAADVASDEPEVLEAIARHAVFTKDPESGLDAVDLGLEIEPFHRSLGLLRGQLLEMEERYDDAIEAYETIVERYWMYDAEEDRLNFDREAGLLASRLYVRTGQKLDRAIELMRATIHVTPTRLRWPLEIQLAEVMFRADLSDEAAEQLAETSMNIPEEELLWRARVAELLDDQERVDYLLPQLDDEQRRLWDEIHESD